MFPQSEKLFQMWKVFLIMERFCKIEGFFLSQTFPHNEKLCSVWKAFLLVVYYLQCGGKLKMEGLLVITFE